MKIKKRYIGIVQGRLTVSKELQSFPKKPFREFDLAKKLGYNFIELFTERKFNRKNPIWSLESRERLKKIAKSNNLTLLTACDNHIISSGFNKKYLIYVRRLIKNLSKLKIKKFIIPLEGKAEVSSLNLKKTILFLNKISQICYKEKINYLLIESNIDFNTFQNIRNSIKRKNIFFLYDLGNRVNFYKNVFLDILKFGNNIKQIHIKDKDSYNKNVLIGKGNVDFKAAFRAIKKISQKNLSFAFENNRGKNPLITARKNINFFKKLIKEV